MQIVQQYLKRQGVSFHTTRIPVKKGHHCWTFSEKFKIQDVQEFHQE